MYFKINYVGRMILITIYIQKKTCWWLWWGHCPTIARIVPNWYQFIFLEKYKLEEGKWQVAKGQKWGRQEQ